LFAGYTASRYGIGTVNGPGAGFFPFYLACALAIFSTALIVRGLTAGGLPGGNTLGDEEKIGSEWPKAAVALAALVAFTFLLDRAGYTISTFCLMIVLLRMGSGYRWLVIVLVAIAITVITYFGANALGVRVPSGSWLE
jgi:hypothetical protein